VLCSSSTCSSPRKKGAKAPLDPWDARSSSGSPRARRRSTTSTSIPTVHALDEFFHRKYEEEHEERPPRREGDDRRGDPGRARGQRRCSTSTCRRRRTGRSSSPSALPIMAYGVIFNLSSSSSVRHRAARRCSAGRSSRRSADDDDYDPPAPRQGAPQGAGDHWLTRRPRPPPTATTTLTRGSRGARHLDRLSNNKLAMWLFLGSECLLFGGLISTYMLYRGRHPAEPRSRRRCSTSRSRRSVELRAADELAHHGARRVGGPAQGRPQHQPVAVVTAAARRHCSSVARSTSSPASTARATASPPACSARASTRSPASTASTSPSASSC
jgi:hypothetical protein